jgi:hypothetical protein
MVFESKKRSLCKTKCSDSFINMPRLFMAKSLIDLIKQVNYEEVLQEILPSLGMFTEDTSGKAL